MPRFTRCMIATALMSLGLWIVPGRTQAGQQLTCAVFDVEIYATPDPQLILHCNDDPASYTAYYGPNSSSCPFVTFDQMEIWSKLLSAASASNRGAVGGPANLVLNWSAQPCNQLVLDSVFLTPIPPRS